MFGIAWFACFILGLLTDGFYGMLWFVAALMISWVGIARVLTARR